MSGAEWSPEVVVDEALARRLIAGQFPAVEAGSLELLAEGRDNTVWVADGRWAFRFPRRAIAIPGVEREIAVLPRLAPLLPAPVPCPELVGRPAHGFPWPFFGAPLLPGREAADAGLGDEERARLAAPSSSGSGCGRRRPRSAPSSSTPTARSGRTSCCGRACWPCS